MKINLFLNDFYLHELIRLQRYDFKPIIKVAKQINYCNYTCFNCHSSKLLRKFRFYELTKHRGKVDKTFYSGQYCSIKCFKEYFDKHPDGLRKHPKYFKSNLKEKAAYGLATFLSPTELNQLKAVNLKLLIDLEVKERKKENFCSNCHKDLKGRSWMFNINHICSKECMIKFFQRKMHMRSTKLMPLKMHELNELLVKLAFKEPMSKKDFFASAKLNGISRKEVNMLLDTLWLQGDIFSSKKGIIERL